MIHKTLKRFLSDKERPQPVSSVQRWEEVKNKPIEVTKRVFSVFKVRKTTIHIKRLLKRPNKGQKNLKNWSIYTDPLTGRQNRSEYF